MLNSNLGVLSSCYSLPGHFEQTVRVINSPNPPDENLGESKLDKTKHHGCSVNVFSTFVILNEPWNYGTHARSKDVNETTDGGLRMTDLHVGFLTNWQFGRHNSWVYDDLSHHAGIKSCGLHVLWRWVNLGCGVVSTWSRRLLTLLDQAGSRWLVDMCWSNVFWQEVWVDVFYWGCRNNICNLGFWFDDLGSNWNISLSGVYLFPFLWLHRIDLFLLWSDKLLVLSLSLLVLIVLSVLLVMDDWLSMNCIRLLLTLVSIIILSVAWLLVSALSWSVFDLVVWVLLLRSISHLLIGLLWILLLHFYV